VGCNGDGITEGLARLGLYHTKRFGRFKLKSWLVGVTAGKTMPCRQNIDRKEVAFKILRNKDLARSTEAETWREDAW
jgi:hypothetical protein